MNSGEGGAASQVLYRDQRPTEHKAKSVVGKQDLSIYVAAAMRP